MSHNIDDRWVGANSIEIHAINWHSLGSHDSETFFDPNCEQCRSRTEPGLLEKAGEALSNDLGSGGVKDTMPSLTKPKGKQ